MEGVKKQPVTYEKLFEYVREERRNVQLQSLPESLYCDIIDYFNIKETDPDARNSEQLKNAKKLVEDIYERREKKILNLALIKSRTQSQLIDVTGLLPEEKVIFKQMVIVLNHYREEILAKTLQKKQPNVASSDTAEPTDEPEHQPESAHIPPGEVRIKILKRIEKFVGPDLEIIGPFEEANVINLQRDVAVELIEKGLAQKFG